MHSPLLDSVKKLLVHPLHFRNKSWLPLVGDTKLEISSIKIFHGGLEPFQTIEYFQIFRVYTRHLQLLNSVKKLRIHPLHFRDKSWLPLVGDTKLEISSIKISHDGLELFQTIEHFQIFRVYTRHPQLLNTVKKLHVHPLHFRDKSWLPLVCDTKLEISFIKIFHRGLEPFQTIEYFQIFRLYTRHQ